MVETKDLIEFIKDIVDWDEIMPEFKNMYKKNIREIIRRLKKYEEWREVASESRKSNKPIVVSDEVVDSDLIITHCDIHGDIKILDCWVDGEIKILRNVAEKCIINHNVDREET